MIPFNIASLSNYLALAYDLYPSHPLITMVSEQYREAFAAMPKLRQWSSPSAAMVAMDHHLPAKCKNNDESFSNNTEEEEDDLIPVLPSPSFNSAVAHHSRCLDQARRADRKVLSFRHRGSPWQNHSTCFKRSKLEDNNQTSVDDGAVLEFGNGSYDFVFGSNNWTKDEAREDHRKTARTFVDKEVTRKELIADLSSSSAIAKTADFVSEATDKPKELVTEVSKKIDLVVPKSVDLVPDLEYSVFSKIVPSAFDHLHADFGTTFTDRIIFFVNFFCNSRSNVPEFNLDLARLCLALINCRSASTATAVDPFVPWFFTGKPRKDVEVLVEALEQQLMTALFAVERYVWCFSLPNVCIATYDPGGTHVSPQSSMAVAANPLSQ